MSSYHFLDDDETLHYLDKKPRMIINLQPFKLILDSLKSESGWSTEKRVFFDFLMKLDEGFPTSLDLDS